VFCCVYPLELSSRASTFSKFASAGAFLGGVGVVLSFADVAVSLRKGSSYSNFLNEIVGDITRRVDILVVRIVRVFRFLRQKSLCSSDC
jgi:hypothetical protein